MIFNGLNKQELIGRIGKEPEFRQLESGTLVGKFSVATKDGYYNKSNEWIEEITWHDVIVWRKMAERAQKHFRSGQLVYISGKTTKRTYTNSKGDEVRITEVVANDIKLLEKKGNNVDQPVTQTTPAAPVGQPAEAYDDDLPF